MTQSPQPSQITKPTRRSTHYTSRWRFDPLNRAVLLLYLDERSHREIGEIVGLGESAVGTRIDRIKQKLRRELA